MTILGWSIQWTEGLPSERMLIKGGVEGGKSRVEWSNFELRNSQEKKQERKWRDRIEFAISEREIKHNRMALLNTWTIYTNIPGYSTLSEQFQNIFRKSALLVRRLRAEPVRWDLWHLWRRKRNEGKSDLVSENENGLLRKEEWCWLCNCCEKREKERCELMVILWFEKQMDDDVFIWRIMQSGRTVLRLEKGLRQTIFGVILELWWERARE